MRFEVWDDRAFPFWKLLIAVSIGFAVSFAWDFYLPEVEYIGPHGNLISKEEYEVGKNSVSMNSYIKSKEMTDTAKLLGVLSFFVGMGFLSGAIKLPFFTKDR